MPEIILKVLLMPVGMKIRNNSEEQCGFTEG